jgi:hypothetical protein
MKLRPSPLLRSRAPHRLAWLAALLSGCFHPTFDRPACSARGECPGGFTCSASRICELSDGGIAPDATNLCFGRFAKVCFTKPPTEPLTVSALKDIDTDSTSPAMCDQQNDRKGNFCVVAAAGITIEAAGAIRAHGMKPLVLVSTTRLTLTGKVDVSSTGGQTPVRGAGANFNECGVGATPPDGAGGGFGGSFGAKGGDGEKVDGTTGGIAGPMVTAPTPTILRGGCAGADGASSGGIGGSGGGAVALAADDDIVLNGSINASGAGGRGGPAGKTGAGGGGSGGMIVLEAKTITGSGEVFANGGGGGQGGTGGGSAVPGEDGGQSIGPANVGSAGTNNNTNGGNGGQGSVGPAKPGGANASGASSGMGGGGAGGGAVGFLLANGFPPTVTAFPTATALPP